MKAELSELVLTCGSWQEAQAIADGLLEKRLVASVEFIEVKSSYTNELKLVMLARANEPSEIETEIKKLHSHDSFVLQSLPVSSTLTKAEHLVR